MQSTLLQLEPVDLISLGAIALVVVVLLVSVALSIRPRRPKALSTRAYNAELFRRRMALEDLPHPVLHEVKVRDGKGGVLKVDQVIRLPASVLLVSSAPLDVAGQVLVSPSAGQWKYVNSAGAVATMVNPVVSLHPLIHAIRSRFPLVKVRLLTVFPKDAEFRGKIPRGCCTADTVLQAIKDMAAEDGIAAQAMDQAWETLSTSLQNASSGVKAQSG